MTDDQLERRLRTLYQVEIVDPAPPIEPLRERLHAIPRRRGWTLPMLAGRRMLPVVVAIVVPLALVGFAVIAGGTSPAPASDEGDIVFAHAVYDPTRRDRPDLAIFTVSSDGGRATRLADVPGKSPWISGLVGPAVRVSPDGSRIAMRLFNDQAGIWVMDRDGSDLHKLVDLPADNGPQLPYLDEIDWSPDSTRIAYTYPYDDVRSPLYVVEAGNGHVTDLTGSDPTRGATRAVAWSPDGSRIAFARTGIPTMINGGVDGLFVMNADGTGERRLAHDGLAGNIRGLAWAPDGKRIAFIWDAPGSGGPDGHGVMLKVIGADGAGLRDLARWSVGGCCFWQSTDLRPIAWSPDGDRIVIVPTKGFDQPEGQPETIMLVRADGAGTSSLAEGSYFDMSPDGSRLVVAEARLDEDPGPYSIDVVSIDGSGKRRIADGEFPVWASVPR